MVHLQDRPDTLVIDKQPPGGVCLNMGCIPSKALIHAANLVEETRHAAELGITLASVGRADDRAPDRV